MSDILTKLKDYKIEILAFAVVSALALAATVLYVGSEQFFYISDFNFYHIAAINSLDSLKQNPLTFLLLLLVSTKLTHNLLFTLPLSLLMLVLGTSRVAFVSSLVISFTLPHLFVLTAIIRQSLPSSSVTARRFLWLAALSMAMVIPVFWMPAWRGYPDNLAALPACIVLLLYLRHDRQLSYRDCVVSGILLALAPLFRRHYFFADIALIVSLLVDQVLLGGASPALSLSSRLVPVIKKFALMGLSFAGFLATFGCMFVYQIVTNNYLNLYKSAATPASECLGYFVTAYGVPLIITAGSGMVLAFKDRSMVHDKVRFLILYSLVLALTWPLFGTHIAHHYLLYWMPFMVFGNAYFVYALSRKSVWLLIPFALYCLFNMASGLTPDLLRHYLPYKIARFGMLRGPVRRGDGLSLIAGADFGPLTRHDLSEMERLIGRLRELAPAQQKILSGCSWDTAEADALRNAERRYFGKSTLSLLNQPYADSSESFALERMLNARYILVTTPVFYLYDKPGEHLADMFVDVFANHWEFTRDLELLPDLYKFDDGYSLTIYRRVAPTVPPRAVRTLRAMIEAMPQYPGGQPIWIDTDNCSETVGETRRVDFKVLANNQSAPDMLSHYLLSSYSHKGNITVSGRAEPASNLTVMLSAYSFDGKLVATTTAVCGADGKFALPLKFDDYAHLVLAVTSQTDPGEVALTELSIKEL